MTAVDGKNHIQFPAGKRCRTGMKKDGFPRHRRRASDHAASAVEQMKNYCAAHPGSPSAVCCPQLSSRGDLWIALLGTSLKDGIVGIGPTVPAALVAFDSQYLARFGRPNETMQSATRVGQSLRASAFVIALLSVMAC